MASLASHVSSIARLGCPLRCVLRRRSQAGPRNATKNEPPWSVRRHGPEGVEQYGRELFEALEFQEFQPDEFIVDRQTVVVLGHERYLVRATGPVVEARWAQIFTLRSGLICQFREYTDTAAWEAGVSK